MFRAPDTFENLIDDSARTALAYALVLYAFFMAVKISLFLFRRDAVNGLLAVLHPNITIDTGLYFHNTIPSMGLQWVILFYAILMPVFLLFCILLSHLLVLIHHSRIGPEAFRTPPDFRQTVTVVLNSTASLFLIGAIPGIGLILGFTWFSITVDEGIAAHYGKNRRKGIFFSYYFPSFNWLGGSFIMMLWIFIYWFGQMMYGFVVPV